ncbi:sigma-70 family RNA polymerase sigma factor [Bacillus licheniformis]|uniref:sigma-70 family RNA polymerase sigma factor n=1 Tax=Bacillus licheniformis TaxID=1402 RepID=UPI002DB8F870|nr:sigma-70 family RNA polymerase sigma factor [Bacillus licheniformis]MEC1494103.1 sigma-70 family RNA polymerase sigma factor [Bacillus licheniformis]
MAHNKKQTIEELYREYYHDIMYYLYRRTHQLETAKDLAQDTFLKAFACLESFRGHSSIKTWLYTIAHHTFINWYRKDKKIQFSDVAACGDMEQHTFEMPERHLANAIMQEELKHHIDRLKEDYQTVLILREFQELSYEEIAEVLNWKLSKVKTNLHRARLELKKSLEGREV